MKHKKLLGVYKFVIFFLLIAFVVSCSFILFLHFLDFSKEEIMAAAPVTFGNVLLITFLFWILDTVRTHVFQDKPVRMITEGLAKITAGDFKTRIEPISEISGMGEYNEIITYINQMTEELSGVETLRTDFVSNVSHEMKTPLAVIQNYAQLLQCPDITDQERLEYASAISDASQRLSELIMNILKLNKLENQQIYPDRKKFNLSEQLCECLLDFESEWEKKEIQIETEIQEDVMLYSDPDLLSLVWHNLISNAIKFTEPSGTVSVTLKKLETQVLVSVEDTGCGISPETGKHIFDKFYQGDTSHASKGNGLGLALVKRIIDITGSEISVQSEPEKGSIFTVTLDQEGDSHAGKI
ncbi:MAG: HAMP domain-containing histidine kinase [Oscillospiraceae bacterium]|nr:HAMP domain-containing histidine kinase [Oscillospiraceae bacterium]